MTTKPGALAMHFFPSSFLPNICEVQTSYQIEVLGLRVAYLRFNASMFPIVFVLICIYRTCLERVVSPQHTNRVGTCLPNKLAHHGILLLKLLSIFSKYMQREVLLKSF